MGSTARRFLQIFNSESQHSSHSHMVMPMLPSKDKLAICFARVAYQMQARFAALNTGIKSFQVWDGETLERQIGEADVLVVSGLWRNALLERANRLRFIQSSGAGVDQ